MAKWYKAFYITEQTKSAQSHNLFLIQYTSFNKCAESHQNLKDQNLTGQKRLPLSIVVKAL